MDPKTEHYDQLQADGISEQATTGVKLVPGEKSDPSFEQFSPQVPDTYFDCRLEAETGVTNISELPVASLCINADNSKKYWKTQASGDEHSPMTEQSRNINRRPWNGKALPKMTDDKLQGLKKGDVGSYGTTYCPWHMIYKYPNHWIGNATRAKVEKHFQGSDILAHWTWDFFYTYLPKDEEPVILVPTTQFIDFLSDLNQRYDLQMAIPKGKIQDSFNFQLGLGSLPPARYLGRTATEKQFNELRENVPAEVSDSNAQIGLVQQKIDLLRKANDLRSGPGHNKKKRSGTKAPERRKGWGQMTKRVQRYLGLRKKEPEKEGTLHDDSVREMKAESRAEVDVNKPTPFEMENSMVFICLDLEMYERNPDVVTEVGIAILDTKDIRDIAPGEHGKNWFKLIKARHIRILENMGCRNFEFVQGCPDRFNFGESELVPFTEVKDVLEQIFEAYGPIRPDYSGANDVVIVGHDLKGDVDGLKKVGFNLYDVKNIREMVDTKNMFQHLTKARDGCKLRGILDAFELHNMYLHNAGNDAVYTMQAMIAVALNKNLKTSDALRGGENDHVVPGDGWSSDEMDDGGLPPPLTDPDSCKPKTVSNVHENPQVAWNAFWGDEEQDDQRIINTDW